MLAHANVEELEIRLLLEAIHDQYAIAFQDYAPRPCIAVCGRRWRVQG